MRKRIKVFILTLTLSCLSAPIFAQAISFNIKNTSVKTGIESLKEKTGYSFVFEANDLDTKKIISVSANQKSIEEIVKQILVGQDADFKINGKSIIITKRDAKPADGKTQKITGMVTDENGEAVIGAAVSIKGTQNGTITNVEGKFSINASKGSTLVVAYIGMHSEEVTLTDATTCNVSLKPSSKNLEEVIVTAALGIKRQARSIGYITQNISGKDLIQSNSSNVLSALSGKLAGVNVSSANQLDGGSTRIVVRGNNSIVGNNQPLIIVDGMPLENTIRVNMANSTAESTSNIKDYGTGINFINPADIEDMNVLKGAAAAALYGAKGGNGVILITTKKGVKKSGLGVDYSYSVKMTDPYRFREQQNEYGYGGPAMAMYTADNDKIYEKNAQGQILYPRQRWSGDRYEAIYGKMPSGLWSFDDKAFTWHGYSTSWGRKMDGKDILWWDGVMRPHVAQPDNQQYFYKNGIQNSHNVSFSNAGDFGSVRIAIGHTDNEAIVKNSNYEQTNFTMGSNLNISKVFKAEVNATYSDYTRLNGMDMSTNNDYFTKFVYNYPVDYRPELDELNYKRADGSLNNNNNNPYGVNPYEVFWRINENNTTQQRNQILGSLKLVYTPTSWLTLMGRAGVDYNNEDIENRRTPKDFNGLEGNYEHSLSKESVTNFDFLATAQKDNLFIEQLNFNFSVGATGWKRDMYGMSAVSGNRFKDPWIYSFQNYDMSQQNNQVKDSQVPTETRLQKQINSVYGLMDLSYANYLFLQVTGRNDWSSTLPINSNSYFYPSASLSFVFSEFMKNTEWLSFGKVRVAAATAAIDMAPYDLYATFNSGAFAGYPTHDVKNFLPATDLKPQRTNSYEFGVDMRFFDSRLKVDATLYKSLSYDQLLTAPIAMSSGFNSAKLNTGELQNKGFEVIASYDILRQKNWNWTLGVNGAHNQNKLLKLGQGLKIIELGQFFGGAGPNIQAEPGEDFGNIYGWDYALNSKGHRIVEVRKDDAGNVIGTLYKTTSERVKLGNTVPALTGGVYNNLRWKNFTLNTLVDFSWGGDIWSGDYATSLSSGLSPSTLVERNGGGLPYTYPDGTKANHGILMEGDLEDGTPNANVVHYIWKYGRLGSWGGGNLSTPSILENNWIKLRELTLSYSVPANIIQKTKFIQNLSISVTGRDLFYIYSSLPDKLNPEATSLTAGNAQGLMFGALPGTRSFTLGVRVGF
jgi:iron complex outermembrane receptor protein